MRVDSCRVRQKVLVFSRFRHRMDSYLSSTARLIEHDSGQKLAFRDPRAVSFSSSCSSRTRWVAACLLHFELPAEKETALSRSDSARLRPGGAVHSPTDAPPKLTGEERDGTLWSGETGAWRCIISLVIDLGGCLLRPRGTVHPCHDPDLGIDVRRGMAGRDCRMGGFLSVLRSL